MVKVTPGGAAWIGLAAYVTVYDVVAVLHNKDTLSEAFYCAVRHPKRRWPTVLAWTFITGHLFKVIPEKYDPLRRIPQASFRPPRRTP